jgi:hypothetical protein
MLHTAHVQVIDYTWDDSHPCEYSHHCENITTLSLTLAAYLRIIRVILSRVWSAHTAHSHGCSHLWTCDHAITYVYK